MRQWGRRGSGNEHRRTGHWVAALLGVGPDARPAKGKGKGWGDCSRAAGRVDVAICQAGKLPPLSKELLEIGRVQLQILDVADVLSTRAHTGVLQMDVYLLAWPSAQAASSLRWQYLLWCILLGR